MAGLKPSKYVWRNGELIPWEDATIHVGTHVIHYGSSVFEGIRCYKTEQGSAVFRLHEHMRRLVDSAKIYRMPLEYEADELSEAALETIRSNGMEHCYIRPLVYRGFHSLGVNPLPCPIETVIMVWEWGAYLGAEALEQGVDVKVSTWNRLAPNTMPSLAKCGANYMNSQLIKMEAIEQGFAEAIALSREGYVSEGSGENLFVIRDGIIFTPPLKASILNGITRDTAITLAHDLGYEVRERDIPRELLYVADELFFTGTAAEITPIRSVDRITVGSGRRGPITEHLQRHFFSLVEGRAEDEYGWLTPVYEAGAETPETVASDSSRA